MSVQRVADDYTSAAHLIASTFSKDPSAPEMLRHVWEDIGRGDDVKFSYTILSLLDSYCIKKILTIRGASAFPLDPYHMAAFEHRFDNSIRRGVVDAVASWIRDHGLTHKKGRRFMSRITNDLMDKMAKDPVWWPVTWAVVQNEPTRWAEPVLVRLGKDYMDGWKIEALERLLYQTSGTSRLALVNGMDRLTLMNRPVLSVLLSPASERRAPLGQTSSDLLARILARLLFGDDDAIDDATPPDEVERKRNRATNAAMVVVENYENIRKRHWIHPKTGKAWWTWTWIEAGSVLSDLFHDEWCHITSAPPPPPATDHRLERLRGAIMAFGRHVDVSASTLRLATRLGIVGTICHNYYYHGRMDGDERSPIEAHERFVTRLMQTRSGYRVLATRRCIALGKYWYIRASYTKVSDDQSDTIVTRAVESGWYHSSDPWLITYRLLTRMCPPLFNRTFSQQPTADETAAGIAERQRLDRAWTRSCTMVPPRADWMRPGLTVRVKILRVEDNSERATWDPTSRTWRPHVWKSWDRFRIDSVVSSNANDDDDDVVRGYDLVQNRDVELHVRTPTTTSPAAGGRVTVSCKESDTLWKGTLYISLSPVAAADAEEAAVAPRRKRKRTE